MEEKFCSKCDGIPCTCLRENLELTKREYKMLIGLCRKAACGPYSSDQYSQLWVKLDRIKKATYGPKCD